MRLKRVEKYPNNANAVNAMKERTTCLRALQKWEEAAEVIEIFSMKTSLSKKKIQKGATFLICITGVLSVIIKQNWSKGEKPLLNCLNILT